ncbi:carbohydrate esterase family 4 protein [Trichoderma compactum]
MKHFKVALGAIALMIAQIAAAPQATENSICGPGLGGCIGGCCSEFGHCGTTRAYCSGSQCQLDYSDSCDTQVGPPGRSTEDIHRPFSGDVPYAETITECDSPGLVALTFDDGPFEYTNQLLDLLDEYKVKATFFIAGRNRGKGRIDDESTGYPKVLRRMRSAGHQLASHTWTHRNLNGVNEDVQRTEMIYNEMAFRNIFGFVPTYMRPPFLECGSSSGCLDTMEELGYHVISTNLDTKDYENDDPVLIQKSKDKFSTTQSTDESSHSYIVLAHDVHYQTVVTLAKYMIETSRERGYKLVTVGECLGDPFENWYRSAPVRRDLGTNQEVPPVNNTNPETPPTPKPNVSTDQRCGGEGGTTCKGSLFGDCCSYWGFCGRSDKHCSTGCNPNFGDCPHLDDDKLHAPIHNTTNGLCGSEHGATCLHFGTKTCCSEYGYCGNSIKDHCGDGCQTGYGRCLSPSGYTEV